MLILPFIVKTLLITTAAHTGSTIVNEAVNGENTTLTEHDYQACKQGDKAACNRSDAYTVVFFPADTVFAVATGNADKIGSHGAVWHEIDKSLPQISQQRASYGGAKYWAMQENYKGE